MRGRGSGGERVGGRGGEGVEGSERKEKEG